MLTHSHNSHTDAYIAVYNPTGSRRTAIASASRIYNKPAVQAYVERLYKISEQRAIDREEAEHKTFMEQLNRKFNISL